MNINDITVRCAVDSDIEAICKFEAQARLTEPDIWGWEFDEKQYKEKLKALKLEELNNSKIVIALHGGVIVGRCDAAVIFSLVNCEKTGYIDWIYMLINYRGKGIGKKLLKGAEGFFKGQGIKNYYLFTASNEQATEFYHRQKDLEFSNREVAEKEIL